MWKNAFQRCPGPPAPSPGLPPYPFSLLSCLPRPLHPGVFIDVDLDLLPGGVLGGLLGHQWRPVSPGRPPHKAWGGLPAFSLVIQGRGRTDFIVASWEQLGLLLPLLYQRPFAKRAACISCGESESVQGFFFNCGVCVYCARILDRCLCVHPMPGFKRVIEDGCVQFEQILHLPKTNVERVRGTQIFNASLCNDCTISARGSLPLSLGWWLAWWSSLL